MHLCSWVVGLAQLQWYSSIHTCQLWLSEAAGQPCKAAFSELLAQLPCSLTAVQGSSALQKEKQQTSWCSAGTALGAET